MIRIALVEDDEHYRNELIAFLNQYASESHQSFRITPFTDGMELVVGYTGEYDIILMDIEMPCMDGMTAAERIREIDSEVIILFITNMPQYVMKGYEVDALDYVLKPVTYFSFSQRIDRALKRMSRRTRRYFTISVKGGLQKLDTSQVTYVEVRDHDLIYHTQDSSYTTKGSLSEAEAILQSEHFFRCNKCYLVNLEYVESLQNYDIQIGNDWIQVSRAKKKAFLDALNNYINEVGK